MRTETTVDTEIWELIRDMRALVPDLTLSDMLQAFTDALKRREGEFASCAACRKGPQGGCAWHAEDRRLARAYHEMRRRFTQAACDDVFGPGELACITEAIRRGRGRPPVYSGTPLPGGKVLVRRDDGT